MIEGPGYREVRDIVPVEIPEAHATTYPHMHRYPTCNARLVMYHRVTVTPDRKDDENDTVQYVGIHSQVGKHWTFMTLARFVHVVTRDPDGLRRRLAVLDAVEGICIDAEGPDDVHEKIRRIPFIYEVLALSPIPYRHLFRVSKALLAAGGPFTPELAQAMADDPELVFELPAAQHYPHPKNVFELRAPKELVVRPRAAWTM